MSHALLTPSKRSAQKWEKKAAYASPFSHSGVEFQPIGGEPASSDLTIHEAGYLTRRPYWNYKHVFSPFWRLYYDFEPGHHVVLGKKDVILGPNRLVLIPDHQIFDTLGTEPKSKLWIHFSLQRSLSAEQSLPIVLRPSVSELALIRDLARALRHAKRQLDRHRAYHISISLLHLVLSRPEVVWQTETRLILEVTNHIEKNFASQMYTTDLARIAHLSESTLRRQFRRFHKVGLTEFISQVRVREVAHLLSNTTLGIDEIAERTGFPNQAYLNRVFKYITGKTPGRFRREVQGLQIGLMPCDRMGTDPSSR